MSGTPAIQLPERLDRVERYGHFAEGFIVFVDSSDFSQMKQRIEQHGRVPHRQHETIPIRPYGVLRIKAKELLPEAVSDWGHRHGSSWLSRIGRLAPIHREGADSVDAGQIHCVERLRNRERRCDAHSISFRAVIGWRSSLHETDRDGGGTLFISSRSLCLF